MPSKKEQELQKLKSKILSKQQETTLDGNIYQLLTQIGSLGDVTGREFECIYKEEKILGFIPWRRLIAIKQKAIPMHHLMTLFSEASKEAKRQEKEMKKAQRKAKK